MPKLNGYVKLNRNLLEWRWYRDANTTRVFLHLLLSANFKDQPFENIIVRRGEVATSYGAIADALHISARQARTAVTHLKVSGTVSVKQYSKFQVISILSWDLYQCDVSGTEAAKSQAEVSQKSTTEECKESKNFLLSELSDETTDKPKQKKAFEHDETPYKAARWLADQIEARMPTCKAYSENQLQAWALDFDRCNRLDGHPWTEINDVLSFSQSDSFWQQNILSGGKFRKQYITLLAKMNGGKP